MSAPWPIHVRLVSNGSMARLNWTGGQIPFQVQQTADATETNSWQNMGPPMQTNSISVSIGPGSRFFRVRGN